MNTSTRVGLVVVIVVAIIAAIAIFHNRALAPVIDTNTTATTTTGTSFDKSISEGTITVAYASQNWGLATNQTQILVKSYIPPCSESFNYCFYYIGSDYKGTNFESAGLRIQKRTDLTTERTCTNTPPEGFDASVQPTANHSETEYASSVFASVGDAGAGHVASGSLYRLYVRSNSSCYEFETRVGQTQYANYPEGSIKQFTSADQAALEAEIKNIINNISLPSGTKNLFS
ncbi:MAG TPA: hypothetical protein VG984_02315 [Candidatus Paceibacterota bacterium]|nr:hypothetical protein [Candidatus Paceibacterota bacterium]